MKTTTIALLLIAGGITSIHAGPATAPAKTTWFLKLFDVDKSGSLDAEERQAAKDYLKMKRKDVIAEWDTNSDGKLDKTEIAALHKHIVEKIHENRYVKFLEIAGEDELMSAAEFATIPALATKSPDKVAKMFGRLDSNADGSLTFAEFKLRFTKHR